MLKLVKLYSNKPDSFPEIIFHDGLNVVYASVTKKTNDKRSSHSLGKTLLADLIDYMLIKEADKDFFLKSKDIFEDFVFFLEVQTSSNLCITIERAARGKVSLYTSKFSTNVLNETEFSVVEKSLGVESARSKLDQLLQLSIVRTALATYRKGLRYCLRRQEEFLEIFKAKNVPEKDRDWKPYLSGLLGINPDLVAAKYTTKENINRLTTAIKELEHVDSSKDAPALEAEIARLVRSTESTKSELNNFSFHRVDEKITKELVDDVGRKIVRVNQELFSVEQKLSDIEDSLCASSDGDISQIRELFEAVSIHLPDLIVKTYDDLVMLNKRMSEGRREHLISAQQKLTKKASELTMARSQLDAHQQKLSQMLIEKESFKKYQILNSRLNHDEANIAVLKERLSKLDSAAELKVKLNASIREEEQLNEKLISNTRQSNNKTLENINEIFSELVKEILGIDAYFYVTLNKEGNPHFQTGISDNTSVDKGHSFTKVMAACFDVSLMTHYSQSEYYRFAYHDGLLESLDDRVKLRLINAWRRLAKGNGLQLIITVLDTDVPEDDLGNKIYFEPEEVVRELNDKGDSGRLFRVTKF